MDCAYQLSFLNCEYEPCRIGNIGQRLQDAGCTSMFLFQDFNSYTGCRKAEDENGKPGTQQPNALRDRCWKLFVNISDTCSGCTDGAIPELLEKVAIGSADSACEPVHEPKYSYCNEVQDVANKVHELCCAGADGVLGNADDPCTQYVDTDQLTKKEVLWNIPDTCLTTPVCATYVRALADNVCPSTFMDNEIPRRIYTDCGGDIHELISHGKPCDTQAFLDAQGLAQDSTPSNLEPGIRHADWGTCFENYTSKGIEAGPYLRSGQRCDLTCSTGWCVEGAQPHCFSGKITMLPNGGGSGGFFDYTPPMECKPQPVSTCKIPPNGGASCCPSARIPHTFISQVHAYTHTHTYIHTYTHTHT